MAAGGEGHDGACEQEGQTDQSLSKYLAGLWRSTSCRVGQHDASTGQQHRTSVGVLENVMQFVTRQQLVQYQGDELLAL